MKLFSLILSITFVYAISSIGNNRIDGHYYDDQIFKEIIIRNDSLLFILHQGHEKLYSNDTVALCHILQLQDNWAEINSFPTSPLAIKSMKIVSRFDDSIRDSIKIELHLPSSYDFDCQIIIDPGNNTFSFEVNEGHGYITIKNSLDNPAISMLSLYPVSHIYALPNKMIMGLAYENFPVNIELDDAYNSYTILLPEVNDSYFERFYVRGEYIRFNDDTLYWRGEKFIKKVYESSKRMQTTKRSSRRKSRKRMSY